MRVSPFAGVILPGGLRRCVTPRLTGGRVARCDESLSRVAMDQAPMPLRGMSTAARPIWCLPSAKPRSTCCARARAATDWKRRQNGRQSTTGGSFMPRCLLRPGLRSQCAHGSPLSVSSRTTATQRVAREKAGWRPGLKRNRQRDLDKEIREAIRMRRSSRSAQALLFLVLSDNFAINTRAREGVSFRAITRQLKKVH